MPPFKEGFVKDTPTTPESVKQTKKREKDSLHFETEKHSTDNGKRKAKRKIRATEELYNIPIASDETTEPECRLTRSHKKAKRSFLPKISDIHQATVQVTKESKQKRENQSENHEENYEIPKRRTRGSIKISNQSKETDCDEKIPPKRDQKGGGDVTENDAIEVKKTVNRKSIRNEIQQTEQELVPNNLKYRRVTRNSNRKSGNVRHSVKIDDDFISKESVHEIMNCKSPQGLKGLPKDSRLTYDVNDIKNSPGLIKNRRETYDVEEAASVTNFEEFNIKKGEEKGEATFNTKKSKTPKRRSTRNTTSKNDENLMNKGKDGSHEVKTSFETKETENEPDNASNTIFTRKVSKNNSLMRYKEDEASEEVENENNPKGKNSENILDIGDNTFTKSTDSEHNTTLQNTDDNNKDTTLKIVTTNSKESKNTSLRDTENKTNDSAFKEAKIINETQNVTFEKCEETEINTSNEKNLIDIKIINETQTVTFEKYEETKETEINTSNENNLIDIKNKGLNSSIDESSLNNGSNNTFATASDFDSSKNDSDKVNVTITHEIVAESFTILPENPGNIKNEQDNGDNLNSTPPPLTPPETDNDPKTPAAKIINRRSTFEIGESINHVTLLKSVCDEFGTPKETAKIKKRKYGESTPHPKKIEDISMLEDETIINLIDSPDDEKEAANDEYGEEDISDSVFEQKRISSINRLKKRRSKSLPICNESLTEFLFNERMTDDNYGKNVTKRKKVTFKQARDESIATSPIDSPIKVSKIPKKLSASLSSLVPKYSHPTSMSTPKPSLNKSNEPLRKISRTKLPNFAEIHKKMFNRMENLKEYSQRKEERSKLLLSGHKPIGNDKENGHSSLKKGSQNSQKKENCHSSLKKGNGNSQKKENGNSSQAKETGKSRKHLNFYQKSKPSNDTENVRKFGQVQNNSATTMFKFGNRSTNSTTNVEVQENIKHVTKFGFKIVDGSKIPTKEEQRKAFVAKTKIVKNNRDDRRNLIQGVRSNRRFDLLMKMREKQK